MCRQTYNTHTTYLSWKIRYPVHATKRINEVRHMYTNNIHVRTCFLICTVWWVWYTYHSCMIIPHMHTVITNITVCTYCNECMPVLLTYIPDLSSVCNKPFPVYTNHLYATQSNKKRSAQYVISIGITIDADHIHYSKLLLL